MAKSPQLFYVNASQFIQHATSYQVISYQDNRTKSDISKSNPSQINYVVRFIYHVYLARIEHNNV